MSPSTGRNVDTLEPRLRDPEPQAEQPPARLDSAEPLTPVVTPVPPTPQPRLSPTVLVVATLMGIFVLTWFSEWTRPAEAVAAVWWPASGLALGLAVRTPRHRLWLVCCAVVVVSLAANLLHSHSLNLAVAVSVAAGIEAAIGALILRAGAGWRNPRSRPTRISECCFWR